jgi:hypothetical protein
MVGGRAGARRTRRVSRKDKQGPCSEQPRWWGRGSPCCAVAGAGEGYRPPACGGAAPRETAGGLQGRATTRKRDTKVLTHQCCAAKKTRGGGPPCQTAVAVGLVAAPPRAGGGVARRAKGAQQWGADTGQQQGAPPMTHLGRQRRAESICSARAVGCLECRHTRRRGRATQRRSHPGEAVGGLASDAPWNPRGQRPVALIRSAIRCAWKPCIASAQEVRRRTAAQPGATQFTLLNCIEL